MELLRSLLQVSALDGEGLRRAGEHRADAILIDLDHTVPLGEKERARELAREAIGRLAGGETPVWVRPNPTHELLAKADLRAVIGPGLHGVMLRRATSKNHIRFAEALLRDAEAANGVEDGTIKLIATIESPAAVLACAEIARASSRLSALAFGAEEYCADLGVERSRAGAELLYPRSHIAVCARVAGLRALDTAFEFSLDDAGLRADAENARLVGFHGKLALGAGQVGTINALFRPTEESAEYARRIVEAHAAAVEAAGRVEVDGRVIDRPALGRARRLIELVTAIEAREAQSGI